MADVSNQISTERLVLGGLVMSEDFTRQTIPFLQPEYFQNTAEQSVFKTIKKYIHEYKSLPSSTALMLDVKNDMELAERDIASAVDIVNDIYTINVKDLDPKWLVKQAEEFCQSKAIYLAIMKSIAIYDGSEKDLTPHAIPDMVKNAISISFDSHIGKDYYDDAEARYDYYTQPENKVPFDLEILNKITNGGCGKKTLNVIAAGVNCGKTLTMCHLAAAYMKMGHNVLYISMEMSEDEILKRVDANLLRVNINKISELGRDAFLSRVHKIREKTHGKIKVKEFPTGAATCAHFSHLLNELKLKQGFEPTIIIIDYIGITGSSRMKMGVQSSYFYLKAVAEEMRALAVETETVVWTALQLNRQGITSSDVEITDVAECISPDSLVVEKTRGEVKVKDLSVGDEVLTYNNRYSVVKMTHCSVKKQALKIKLKSGKEIICSPDHSFPTDRGRLKTKDMILGDRLSSM